MEPRRWRSVVCFIVVSSSLVTACAGGLDPDAADGTSTTPVVDDGSVLGGVSERSRVAMGEGEPRSASYWMIWSSCGDNNRASTAAANGGRAAGWIVMDDVLESPGVALGGHGVESCEEGIAILDGTAIDLVDRLARQALVTELNLNVGSKRCQAVEESIVVAQTLLTATDYGGPDTPVVVDVGLEASVEDVEELLTAYNSGELCR